MQITILAVGTKMPAWVNDAFTEYSKRLSHDFKVVLKEIKPVKRGSGVNAEQGIAQEEARILEAIPPGCFLVILDERGQSLRSLQLAEKLKQWQLSGQNLCFVIGGADGLGTQVKKIANLQLKLSDLTLPHGMVRVLLIEQLYRSLSILNNHPYHRE